MLQFLRKRRIFALVNRFNNDCSSLTSLLLFNNLFNHPRTKVRGLIQSIMIGVLFLSIACIALSIICVLLSRRVSRLEKALHVVYDSIPKF